MNGLPQKKVHKSPQYFIDKLAKVTSAANYRTNGTIEVMFLDHGKSLPVWVVGDISREPMVDDMVVIGYMEGRKDAPYLKGFVSNQAYTSNFIDVGKDYIRIQLPFDSMDISQHLQDDFKKNLRAYIELNASGIALFHPTTDIFLNTPNGNVKMITKTGTQTF